MPQISFVVDRGGSGSPPKNEQWTDAGKSGIDLAIAPYLEDVASGVVIIEGYAQQGMCADQYRQSRARESLVREHLIAYFQLDPGKS